MSFIRTPFRRAFFRQVELLYEVTPRKARARSARKRENGASRRALSHWVGRFSVSIRPFRVPNTPLKSPRNEGKEKEEKGRGRVFLAGRSGG